jgi:mevalonate pyrophosphate decarboxylase
MTHLYAGIVLVAVVAGGYFWINSIVDENAELRTANVQLERDKVMLEGKLAVEAERQQLRAARDEVAANERIDNAIRAEQEKNRVTAERLASASAGRAQLVENLAHKAILNNTQVLACLSDLRNAQTYSDCGTVR